MLSTPFLIMALPKLSLRWELLIHCSQLVLKLPHEHFPVHNAGRLSFTVMCCHLRSATRIHSWSAEVFILTFDGIFRLPLSHESNMYGFANDVTYLLRLSVPADEPAVFDDLASISNWLSCKGFKLNNNKVKAMIISRKKVLPSVSSQLRGSLFKPLIDFAYWVLPSRLTYPGSNVSWELPSKPRGYSVFCSECSRRVAFLVWRSFTNPLCYLTWSSAPVSGTFTPLRNHISP